MQIKNKKQLFKLNFRPPKPRLLPSVWVFAQNCNGNAFGAV